MTAPAPVEIPQSTQRTVVRHLIRSQATNSSPTFLSLPREEMATREKPHTSRSPAAWRLGAVDERAENAGRSSIQNSTSLQHPKTAGRLLTAFAPIAGIDYFWHFTAFLPKSTRRLLSCSARKGAHVFGSTLLISRAMAKRKKQRTKQRFASAYERYQKIALDEARRVAWPQLMQFVDESLRWEVFNLWIRAVVNAANGIPQVIEQELESRSIGGGGVVGDGGRDSARGGDLAAFSEHLPALRTRPVGDPVAEEVRVGRCSSGALRG